MPSIQIEEHELVYDTAGDPNSPPLVLLHGCLSHRGVWTKTIETLQEEFYCVAIDLLGLGDSAKPHDADYNIPAHTRRILKVIDELNIDNFHLIGHSMGGQISMYLASTLAADRVAKLIDVSGVASANLHPLLNYLIYPFLRLDAVFPVLTSLWRWLDQFRWFAYFHFMVWFHKMDAISFDAWETDRYMAMQPGMEVSGLKNFQAIYQTDLTPLLSNIKAPTLIIFGKEDGTVPVSDGYLAKENIPNSELVLISDCGHFPMYEKPDEYLDALHKFLRT